MKIGKPEFKRTQALKLEIKCVVKMTQSLITYYREFMMHIKSVSLYFRCYGYSNVHSAALFYNNMMFTR